MNKHENKEPASMYHETHKINISKKSPAHTVRAFTQCMQQVFRDITRTNVYHVHAKVLLRTCVSAHVHTHICPIFAHFDISYEKAR